MSSSLPKENFYVSAGSYFSFKANQYLNGQNKNCWVFISVVEAVYVPLALGNQTCFSSQIREQAHQYGIKDEVMTLSGMIEEKSEGEIGLMTGERKGPGRGSEKGSGTERGKGKEIGKEKGRRKESWSEIVLGNGRGKESGTKTGTGSGTETETMTGKGNERGRGRRNESESGRSEKGSGSEKEIVSGNEKGIEVETGIKKETARETGTTKKKEGKTAGIREKISEKKEAQEMSMRRENPSE